MGLTLTDCRVTYLDSGGRMRLPPRPLPLADDGDRSGRLDVAQEDLRLWLEVEPGATSCRVRVRLRNLGPVARSLGEVVLQWAQVTGFEAPADLRWLCNGHQSWSETRSFGATDRERQPRLAFLRRMQDNLLNPPGREPGQLRSEMFALLGPPTGGPTLLLGQEAPLSSFLYLRAQLHSDGRPPALQARIDLGGRQVQPGEELVLDPVRLQVGPDPNTVLDAYLDDLRVPSEPAAALPVGWCSWYYYFTRVTADDMLANLSEARRREVDWQWFQLDDGYQQEVGDWLDLRPTFAGRMGEIANAVREAGLRPGIWLAPFLARRSSRLYAEHPDWFLRGPSGGPASAGYNPMWGLGGRCVALDTTHPEVQDWLRNVVGTMVRTWGFDYLKLDFLYAACVPGRAHDPGLSPAGRLALGLDVVREAAGPGVFLLGCGAPLGPCVGRVDAMRVGPDVAPYWFPWARYHLLGDVHALSAAFAIRSMLVRAQLNRRLWLNDPDCLLLRQRETRLSATERRTLTHAVVITGGMFFVSDRLAALSDATWERLAEIQALARACYRGRCWPLDLLERPSPELVYNTAGYLAAFNFEDRPRRRLLRRAGRLAELLPPGAVLRCVDSGESIEERESAWDLGVLAGHGSRLLQVHPPRAPLPV